MAPHNAACFHVIRANHERAIDLIEKAASLGFDHRAWIETDHDLAPLHGHPRIDALLARISCPSGSESA